MASSVKYKSAGILEAADLKDERLLPSFNDQVDHDIHGDHGDHDEHEGHDHLHDDLK